MKLIYWFILILSLWINIRNFAWSMTADEFERLPIEKQRRVLSDIGCHEGEPGPADADLLKAVLDRLNKKALNLDYKKASKDELLLIKDIVWADACLAYSTGEKVYHLIGCKILYMASEAMDPEDVFDASFVCYDKHPQYTEAEKKEIYENSLGLGKRASELAVRMNHPRKNLFRFYYGAYMCRVNIDCPKGLEIMYEAALDEYIEKGVEGFDKDLANEIGALEGPSYDHKYIKGYLLCAEIRERFVKAGRIPSTWNMSKEEADGYYESLKNNVAAKWETETQKVPKGSLLEEEIAKRRKRLEEAPSPTTFPIQPTPPSPITQPAEKELPVTGPVYEKPSPITSPVEKPVSSLGHLIRIFLILIYILIGIVVIGIILTIVLLVRKGER